MLLGCALSLALAQNETGSVRGVVTDPSASVIPNASVTATAGQAFSRTARTDALGRYQLNGLPAGSYTIRGAAAGFAPWEQTEYQIRAGQIQTFDMSLVLRSQVEQVTVGETGASTVDTDPSNNGGALVLQKADLDALPDDKDDLTADLQALAGPAAGPNGGQFFIDGFTGGRLPPKQSIREIRINQNPFAAQFDRPGQGRVEIFTKPGSDEFHGDVLFQFSDGRFNTRNPFVTTKPPYQRRQWEGEVGGPVGKKTSFFADFERRDINENAFVNALVLDSGLNIVPFTAAVVTPLTGIESNLKVDRQLSTNHTLSVRFGYARDTNDNSGVGGFSLPGRAYHVLGTENTFQVIETGVLNVHTVNETRFRFRKQNSDQNGGTAAPTITVTDAFSSGGSPVGNSFDHQNRYELQNFTSYIVGTHTFRFGGLIRGVSLSNQAMQNYPGTFTFTSLNSYRATLLGLQNGLTPAQIRAAGAGASQFSIAAGNPLASLSQFDYGIFAQDDWRLRQGLTISAGLRYETQTNSRDRSDIAPRLGVAWALGHNAKNATPKNVIRAGFGIFYDRLSESLTLDALRLNGIRQQQFLIPNPDFYPTVPTPASLSGSAQPQTIRETYANWRAPAMIQAAIGFERQLPKHVTVATNYIHTTGIHALRSRNINAPLPGTSVLPYGGVNSIYLYETSGVYRQNQLMTNVNARISSKLSLSGYYAYGTAHSNTDGAGSFPSNQYDLSTEYGRAGFDVRHRLQFNGTISARGGFRFSPFLTVASGRPFNITTGRDLNGDGLFTDRPSFAASASEPGVRSTRYGLLNPTPVPGELIVPRNFGNGPGLVAANLRISKAFNLGETKAGKDPDRQIVLSVNARNILNHPNFGLPAGNLSSQLFGQSTSLVTAGGGGGGSSGNRRLDLQLRFNF